MTDPNEMTADEQARVHAVAEHGRPVKLISPGGRTVTVYGWQVAERLTNGYRYASEEGE